MNSKTSPNIHTKITMEIKLIISSIVLLIIALCFNGLLSLLSLEKLYVESFVSKYSVIAKDLQRNVEAGLRFRKSLEKFVGIEKLLEQSQQNLIRKIPAKDASEIIDSEGLSKSDISVSVALPNGSMLYSTEETFIGVTLPANILKIMDDSPSKTEYRFVKFEDKYFMTLPVHSGSQNITVAYIVISFSDKQIKALLHIIQIRSIKIILLILIVGFFAMVLLINMVLSRSDLSRFPKTKISASLFLVIGISQIVFTGLNTNAFKDYYLHIAKEKSAVLSTIVKEDIEFLLSKGLEINRLFKMDVMLGEIISAAPELESMTIMDNHRQPLYMATQTQVVDFQKLTVEEKEKYVDNNMIHVQESEYHLSMNIVDKRQDYETFSENTNRGIVATYISRDALFNRIKEMVQDSVTILVISFLFLTELIILLILLIFKNIKPMKDYRKSASGSYGIARSAAFLFIFGSTLSRSFLPLYAGNLYHTPLFGLSKDFVIGLPISIELFVAAIVLIPVGTWIDRRGWHEPFLSGLFLSMIGIFLSGISGSIIDFVLYRSIVGIGYGLAWMSIQGFVVMQTNMSNRASGISYLTSGIFAGSICGGAVGGMLAQRIGFRPVFFIASVVILLSLIFSFLLMKDYFLKPEAQSNKSDGFSIKELYRLFSDRNAFLIFLCSLFPYAICMVGMLFYAGPVYLSRIGTSQSNIGRVLMIFGLCMIYIAPAISKVVDRVENRKDFISLGGLLAGIGMILFYFYSGFWAVVLSMLLFGISISMSSTSSNAILLNLKISQEIGMSKVLGAYRSVDKFGQMLGPIVVGSLFTMMGMERALGSIGVVYLLLTLLFVIGIRTRSEPSLQKTAP